MMSTENTNPSNPREDEPTLTNEIGYPQYERTLEHFYLWTSGGSLKDKLREFAVHYENGRRDGESEAYLDQMYNAIISFFDKREATMKAEWEAKAVQAFCQEVADKVRLEFEAGGRYPGHIIQPWEDVARPMVYGKLAAQTNGEGQ